MGEVPSQGEWAPCDPEKAAAAQNRIHTDGLGGALELLTLVSVRR